MLDLTAAARAEDSAKRLRPRRRLTQYPDWLGDRVALLDFDDAYPSSLARKRPEAKNHDAAGPSDALTVCEEIRKFQLEFDAAPQCRVVFKRCVSARQAP